MNNLKLFKIRKKNLGKGYKPMYVLSKLQIKLINLYSRFYYNNYVKINYLNEIFYKLSIG